jgi:GT2 family glycosyltransferase/glycosyltransferase involved in cell wall biosynthesis
MKCDVIIPVFNAPDWVKLCVRRLISQTPDEYLNQIILVDDGSNDFTKGFLEDLAAGCLKIVLVRNEKNEGFVKSINRGLSLVKAPYILLLNSDCMITKNTIPKLIAHATEQDNIGLVSPVSNHSPVVSLEMIPGYSFIEMNHLVERLFPCMSFPACTIVGNCLLITRACFEQTGFFDLCWGKGYGEESDYQFRAMQKGFEARIAIDTYVYHQSQASFDKYPELATLRRNHYQMFIDKWGKEYNMLYEQYKKNDPIAFMRESIKEYLQNNAFHPQYDVIYYLPGISQTIGGVHIVVDIINYLILEDIKAGLAVGPDISPFYDKMFFHYLTFESIPDFLTMSIQTAAITATSWNTVYPCSLFASLKNIPLIYFVQGYEVAFRNGINYGSTESTYAIADDIIVTSHWLHEKLLSNFGVDSHVIPNGFDDAVFYPEPGEKNVKNARTVTMILRGSVEKGDWVLMDLMKSLLREKDREIDINMIYFSDVAFGEPDSRLHLIRGPLRRHALADLLRQTDIFVDASLHEGFGMFPLEAMACGAVPVVSDSGGINQFVVDGQNGIIIREVNKVKKYVSAVKRLIDDPDYYWTLKTKSSMNLKVYSIDTAFVKYATYYRNVESVKKKDIYKKIGAFHVQNMGLDTGLDTGQYIEFFVDTGKGFNAAQSKKWKFDAKHEKIVINLNDYPHACSIRFDPLNNFVKIRLKKVRVLCKKGEFYDVTDYQTNALFVEDSTFMFGTDDPQVFFPLRQDKEPEQIVVEVNYLLRGRDVFAELLVKCQMRMHTQDSELNVKKSELQAKNSELQAKEGEIQLLREQLKQREGLIDLITLSRSWRLTKPLRLIKELFHGGVKRS